MNAMVLKVTLKDCAEKIGDFMESRITHEELVEWSRRAMLAIDIPKNEYEELMSLLQDISVSTPKNLRSAVKHYKAFTTPLQPPFPPPGKR
ncbi:MAG TPA: hypothetical protein VK968_04565 [Roseimicrobium sp.]|nr:hypothetical protein [Roseimicrobium sp.]